MISNYGNTPIGPGAITVGGDGDLWFTNGWDSIGRISTSGVVVLYKEKSKGHLGGMTAGPDGALWFTSDGSGERDSGNSIGRITTAGVVSLYRIGIRKSPGAITAGPDGALWFTDGDNSIGRITTAGVVSKYTGTGIDQPGSITSGPDGALWFTNANNSIGRITTAGVVSNYTGTGSRVPPVSPRDPTERCGSRITTTIRSGESPHPVWCPTTPAPALTSQPVLRPAPTARCGLPTVAMTRSDGSRRHRLSFFRLVQGSPEQRLR